MVYDPASWTSAPNRVMHRNQAVAVDAYRLVANDTLYLLGTHSRDALLYVIGPQVPPTTARSVLDIVDAGRESIGVALLRRLSHAQPESIAYPTKGAAL